MIISKISDHATQAKNRLLTQYRNKPNIEALVDAYIGNPVQDIENAYFTLVNLLDLDNSTGNMLDVAGKLIGKKRGGLNDDNYRIFIKGQISVNISTGSIENIINTWSILSSATKTRYLNRFNATLDLLSDGSIDSSVINDAFELAQRAAKAGVRVNSVGVFDLSNPFALQGTDSNFLGFSSASSQGSATSTGTDVQLIDSGAIFQTDLVTTSMLAINVTTNKIFTISSIDSEIQITVNLGSETSSFSINDSYYINKNTGGKISYLQSFSSNAPVPGSVKRPFEWTNGVSENQETPNWNSSSLGFEENKYKNTMVNWPFYVAGEWLKRTDILNNFNTVEGDKANQESATLVDTDDLGELVYNNTTTLISKGPGQTISSTLTFVDGMEIKFNPTSNVITLTAAGKLLLNGNNVIEDVLFVQFSASGTLPIAVEINGDNVISQNIMIVNIGTGTITDAIKINSGVKGCKIIATTVNLGAGSITNPINDVSGNTTNIKEVKSW